MSKRAPIALALLAVWAGSLASPVAACTNYLITKGASADGSVMSTYAADAHELYGELYYLPGATFGPGAMRDVVEWDTGKLLDRIPQPAVTFTRVGNLNEHQVSIGETTYGGRKELEGPSGTIDYGSLMYIALERAKTAREAIQVMTNLTTAYGYASVGESFSIADPDEAWILEMIGKGKDQKGALWVAVRLPDGTVSAHANQARIRTFPLNDPSRALYAKDVIAFAREKGWFQGKDEEFSFADTYAPIDFGAIRFCEARVWSFFRRVAPSQGWTYDQISGAALDKRLPLWIKPDKKLSAHDVMELMRDHFEGTEIDMTKGLGAGPFACPYRWRPMTWKVDGKEYVHERAVSTQQTGCTYVAQSRGWLPDPVGGVLWFGVDDTFSTVYVPMYAGLREVPRSFAVGTADFETFSWDSAFWVFNWVANMAYARYSDMIVDVQTVQRELEGTFLAEQAEVDGAAADLFKRSPGLARDYLTRYSVERGERVTARWRKLGEQLLLKYLDGNVRDAQGKVQHPTYPEPWYRALVAAEGAMKAAPEKKPE